MSHSGQPSPADDLIYQKLVAIFNGKETEGLLRVLWYLDQDRHSGVPAHAWNSFRSLLNSDIEFRGQAHQVVEVTRSDEMNRTFRLTLSLAYEEIMEGSRGPSSPTTSDEGFDFVGSAELDLSQVACFPTLGKCWPLIPPGTQSEILQTIPDLVASRKTIAATSSSSATAAPPDFVKKFTTGLEDIALSSEAIRNLQRWWGGEISGKQCAGNIARGRGVQIGIRLTGAIAGSRMGSLGGPMGRQVGSLIGLLLTAGATAYFASKMNEKFDDEIPKEEALDQAYKFFGVPPTATDAEVNAAFRKMCLKHHPDKGGKAEDFILVQVNMGVIKCAREAK